MANVVDVPSNGFVGRRRELGSLKKTLLASADRRTRSVLIQGETGIGKTRLAAEFAEQARQMSIRVLQGCCYQVPEAGPYFPFRQVLGQLRTVDSAPVEFLRSLADDALGEGQWVQLSEDVRGRRARFLTTLSDAILEEATTEESLLLIEDIQWADIGSLLVLNNLLDMRGSGLMIVCTARSGEALEEDVRQLIGRIEQKSLAMILRGLPLPDVKRFVENGLGQGRITDEEIEALDAFTNGNPMLLRELLLHVQESGLLERQTLQEVIRRIRTPERLGHFVDLRLRSLPQTVLRSLSACSVVGMDFAVDLIAELIGESWAKTVDQLETAVSKGLLESTDAAMTTSYKFAHPLFAKRLYDMVPTADRRALHRKVAVIATSGAISLTFDELARHYGFGFGAAGGRKAVDYCQAAAEEAESILAYEKAAHFWGLALTCTTLRSRRRRAELYRRQGWALWAAGKWDQAADAWSTAVPLFAQLGLRRREAEVALALGDMHRWRYELTEAEDWLRRALGLGLTMESERGRALAQLGGIRRHHGDSEATQLLEEAEHLILHGDLDPTAAYWLSVGFRVGGQHAKAHAVARTGLKQAQRGGHAGATTLLAASLVNYELGELHLKAARSYVRIGKRAAQKNDPTSLINSWAGEALYLGYTGRWDQVTSVCERWMAQVRLASKFQVATASMFWAEAQLAQGECSAAAGAISAALPHLGEMHPIGALHLARAWVRSGRDKEAAELARRHLPSVAASPRWTSSAGRAILGDTAASLDEPELWRTCYELLRREPFPVVMAYSPLSVQRVLGRLASRRRLWKEAIAHFETAVNQLDQGGARWELAQTYLDYAEVRKSRGRRGDFNRATAMELQARAILDELGIEHPASQREHLLSGNGNRFGLTARELEVLAHVAGGKRNAEIAEELSLSPGTVNRHVENIFVKMDVSNRTEAVIRGVEEKLVGPGSRRPDRLFSLRNVVPAVEDAPDTVLSDQLQRHIVRRIVL